MNRRKRIIALAQWILLGALVGVVCGAASALFLWLLDVVTNTRNRNEILVLSLPLAGLAIGWVYERFGQPIKAGNNLIIDTIHDNGPEIPVRMAPMVLLGTVLTHLFGGSAGREGTAVQMGASLADWLSHRLKLDPSLRNKLLAAGVAGGFGSVFGTPIAGTVFGLEFVVLGHIEYAALLPALVASLCGDLTTRALGIAHTVYAQAPFVALSPWLMLKWLAFAAAVALTTTVFIELTHFLKKHGEQRIPRLPLRMALGGVVVLLLWKGVGSSDYLGLGVPMIVQSFEDPHLPVYAFALKLLFTAITLGAGFLGGEVTPLFFVGAALGNVMARVLDLPLELGAGIGMAAVFAAASNTPLALSVMAVELLGANVLPHVVIVSGLGFLLTGHRSIYPAQRLFRMTKGGAVLEKAVALRELGRPEVSSKPNSKDSHG